MIAKCTYVLVGETGAKIKDMLKTTGEMLSNGLSIVDGVAKLFEALDLGKLFSGSKRVLEQRVRETVHAGIPGFVEPHQRSLLGAPPGKFTPNAVVALDGTGKYKTIGAAIAAAPINSTKLFIIQVKAGVYKEVVKVPGGANNVVLIGEGPTKTVISGSQSFVSGIPTFQTATLGKLCLQNCV